MSKNKDVNKVFYILAVRVERKEREKFPTGGLYLYRIPGQKKNIFGHRSMYCFTIKIIYKLP